jgi:thioredoxin-dependent peroxiredoxin
MSRQLGPGDQAPNFTLPDQSGSPWQLYTALEAGPVVLFFYPKDNTPVCTKEACTFRDHHSDFMNLGAQVVGVSGDSEKSHVGFQQRHELPYTLLSDADGQARKLFGIKKTLGLFDGRVTFVIGSDRKIATAFSSALNAEKHVREALAAAGGLSSSRS